MNKLPSYKGINMVHVVPSYKIDQDFWDFFRKGKPLGAKLHKTDLDFEVILNMELNDLRKTICLRKT